MLFDSSFSLIGNTPTLRLLRLEERLSLKAELYAKLEQFSLTGSVKDRIALAMIEEAEKRGELRRGSVIIEPTSGNTGIGLAAVGAVKGYKVIIVMPESMSEERRALIRAYGAEICLTPASLGMQGAIERAQELKRETENAFIPSQFENPANPRCHYERTAAELCRDIGVPDVFVAGVGTGGTITGVGKFIKEKNPAADIIAVEPLASPVLSEGRSGRHGIQGIGAGFVPKVLDMSFVDAIVAVSDEEAISAARLLASAEGLFCGISSGAVLAAASALAASGEYGEKRIAMLFPDTGMRYLSTALVK